MKTAAVLLIGDEILSGRTQDTNLQFIAKHLQVKGIPVTEARVVPDQEKAIIAALLALHKSNDFVFTTGGIGFTHDDITVACVAKAFNVPLEINQEAKVILENYYKEDLNASRLQMAYMPVGAQLIANPLYAAPSFHVNNVFVLAGIPSIMQGMFLSILSKLPQQAPILSTEITTNFLEGQIAEILREQQNMCLDVNIGSYPFSKDGQRGTAVVIKGTNKTLIEKVENQLKNAFKAIE